VAKKARTTAKWGDSWLQARQPGAARQLQAGVDGEFPFSVTTTNSKYQTLEQIQRSICFTHVFCMRACVCSP